MMGAQAPLARVPLAGYVLGTGWCAADAARVQPYSKVAVVADGAVGLLGVLAADHRDEPPQNTAGPRARARIWRDRNRVRARRGRRRPHQGADADSLLECVGAKESMTQALQCARPGAMIGYVGVPHGVGLDGAYAQRGLMGARLPYAGSCRTSRSWLRSARSTPARCSTCRCRSPISRRVIGSRMSGAPSRPCCASNRKIEACRMSSSSTGPAREEPEWPGTSTSADLKR
jgi:hypothetical protein